MGKTLDKLKSDIKALHPDADSGIVDRGLETLVECLMEGGDEILVGALERLSPDQHAELTETVKRLRKENLQ